MLRLSELKLPLDHDPAELEAAVCRRLRLAPTQLRHVQVVRRSVDARRKGAIALVYCLDLDLALDAAAEQRLLQRFRGDSQLQLSPDTRYKFVLDPGEGASWELGRGERPLVIGAGPCGYFAALLLAQMGLRPLLLERGKAVKERTADTFGFWRGQRRFDPESNAQFGEGGAGTFSDGKLYSQVKDPRHLSRKVLEELVAAGASPEILELQRPHIGTFKLATVVRGLRARIEALGGEVRFGSRVEQLLLGAERQVCGVVLADGRRIEARQVVLAVGHSARDSFAMLQRIGVALEPKPFAIGVRIEHPQPLVDRARWGEQAGHPRLGPAEYKLVHHCQNGRSVYSFCMCPGGLVVGATSEEGRVVTNGMSQHSRNERNANSAIVVTITPEDLAPYGDGPEDPLAGVAFQRHWEALAFAQGGGDYRAPAQRLGDFLAGCPSSESSAKSSAKTSADASADAVAKTERDAEPGVRPSYAPGIRFTDLEPCLPAAVVTALREALPAFERQLPGFAMEGAVLTGVETRTSSPLRLPRHKKSLESVNTPGLYPAGEGAGYAGGILSAALDGIRTAEAAALTLRRLRCPGAPDGSACGPS